MSVSSDENRQDELRESDMGVEEQESPSPTETHRFQFMQDYRSGPGYAFQKIGGDTGDAGDDVEDGTWDTFTVIPAPVGKFRVYLLWFDEGTYDFPCDHIVDTDTTEEAGDIMQQIHSHINECGPFRVTGYNSAYKEEGDYGDPIPVLSDAVLSLRTDGYSSPTVALVVDENNDIVSHLSICPCA